MTSKLQQIFNKKGYFVQRNIFSNEFIDNLIDEINKIKMQIFIMTHIKNLEELKNFMIKVNISKI